MHKSSDNFFSKILEKPSIVEKKMKGKPAAFFTEMKQQKIQNGHLKKPHFLAPPILYIFSWNFSGLVLELVDLIDGKDIGVA